jgi:N,N'-diacetyllegionaminate synthase
MKSVMIIAEAGVNHNGELEIAKKLIEVAAEAKADYVKFQTAKVAKSVSKYAQKADYQKINTGKEDESMLEMVKKFELDKDFHIELINHCKKCNIKFLSSPFDIESVDLLTELGIDLIKIPSGEITNLPYLIRVANAKLPVIFSTGMADMCDIEATLNVLLNNGLSKKDITILHCNTEYPTPMKDVNLNAMLTIKNKFDVKIGYSDHTLGIEIPIAATALGAQVIEKHFTLDKKMEGPDHIASLEPDELKKMVTAIRNIEIALGSGIKEVTESELKNKNIARKSIHLAKDLKLGSVITFNDLAMKRPGGGISPMDIDKVIGKKTNKDLFEDRILNWEDLH